MENYKVTLEAWTKPSRSPQAAVANFLDGIMEVGLRRWVYIVTNDKTGDVYYSDGHGNLMDQEGMRKYVGSGNSVIPPSTTAPAFPGPGTATTETETEDDLQVANDPQESTPEPKPKRRRTKKTEQAVEVETVSADVLNEAMGQVASD